ncbi:MAG: hypothetical protein PUD26_04260 [bacterium]|nr:hypothetical protein [bacterium]MDD6025797.1 hypothetical protein [bacterium]
MKHKTQLTYDANELLSSAELYEIKGGKSGKKDGNECSRICTQCLICPTECTVCTTNVKNIFRR